MLEVLNSKYEENNLPFNVIVPSLPGYCYSNGPPLDRDFTVEDIAKVMDKLKKLFKNDSSDSHAEPSHTQGATAPSSTAMSYVQPMSMYIQYLDTLYMVLGRENPSFSPLPHPLLPGMSGSHRHTLLLPVCLQMHWYMPHDIHNCSLDSLLQDQH